VCVREREKKKERNRVRESDAQARRHTLLLFCCWWCDYPTRRRRTSKRNARGGGGGGSTFALSWPVTTVRKVIRGFSRRRAPGFYTATTTAHASFPRGRVPPSPYRELAYLPQNAPPPPLTSWRKIGPIPSRAVWLALRYGRMRALAPTSPRIAWYPPLMYSLLTRPRTLPLP